MSISVARKRLTVVRKNFYVYSESGTESAYLLLDAQEVIVGDDAEFQMEFEAHGAWWEDLGPVSDGALDADPTESGYVEADSYFGGTPLLVCDDGAPRAIWGWDEAIPMPFTLGDLHARWGIGTAVFSCATLPTESQLDDLSLGAFESGDTPAFEALIVTHDDEIVLEAAADELASPHRPLRERMIGEMMTLMLQLVQASPSRSRFVFALAQERPSAGI